MANELLNYSFSAAIVEAINMLKRSIGLLGNTEIKQTRRELFILYLRLINRKGKFFLHIPIKEYHTSKACKKLMILRRKLNEENEILT